MNKEEILAKSRKENVLQDEMERTVRIEGESFSLIRLYRLTKRRNTSDVVTLLISLAFLAWNLVRYFTQGW